MTNSARKTVTAAEAKAHFADSLRVAEEGGVVVVTRYGKPVAALVQFADLESIERLRGQSSAEGLGGLFHLWDDAEELTDKLDKIERSSEAFPSFEP